MASSIAFVAGCDLDQWFSRKSVRMAGELQPGDVFQDYRFHPCFCLEVGSPEEDDPEGVYGISLVESSFVYKRPWTTKVMGVLSNHRGRAALPARRPPSIVSSEPVM